MIDRCQDVVKQREIEFRQIEIDANRCPQASFVTKREAAAVQADVRTNSGIGLNYFYCEKCDNYHLRAPYKAGGHGRGNRLEILRLTALGFTVKEIATRKSMSVKGVENDLYRMRRRFYALSTTHLVAIVISLGIIDPREFVPKTISKGYSYGERETANV